MTIPTIALKDLARWTEILIVSREELLDLAGRVGALHVLDDEHFREEAADIVNGIKLLVAVLEKSSGEIALRSQGCLTLSGGLLT